MTALPSKRPRSSGLWCAGLDDASGSHALCLGRSSLVDLGDDGELEPRAVLELQVEGSACAVVSDDCKAAREVAMESSSVFASSSPRPSACLLIVVRTRLRRLLQQSLKFSHLLTELRPGRIGSLLHLQPHSLCAS